MTNAERGSYDATEPLSVVRARIWVCFAHEITLPNHAVLNEGRFVLCNPVWVSGACNGIAMLHSVTDMLCDQRPSRTGWVKTPVLDPPSHNVTKTSLNPPIRNRLDTTKIGLNPSSRERSNMAIKTRGRDPKETRPSTIKTTLHTSSHRPFRLTKTPLSTSTKR